MFHQIHISKVVRIAIVLVLLAGVFAVIPVRATTLVRFVKWNATGANNGSSWTDAYTDLQSALSAASSGDEIWVAAGTYKPTTDTDRGVAFELVNGIALYGGFTGTETLRTQRDPFINITILSGDIGVVGDQTDNSYQVVRNNNPITPVVFDGFTVTAGNATGLYSGGGGLYNHYDSVLLIANSTFTDHIASYGGGIQNYGTMHIFNSTISENSAMYNGGGIFNFGTLYIMDSIVSDNSATSAGGILNYDLLDISDSAIKNNSAEEGGGIYNTAGELNLEHSIVSSNSAVYGGGGIMTGGTINIINATTISDNSAEGGGGIGFFAQDTTVIITNSTFFGNSAHAGGGIFTNGGLWTLSNNSFFNNSSDTLGGGIQNNWGVFNIINNTFSGNSASQGGGILNSGTLNLSNTIIANSNSGGDCDNGGGDIILDINNLIETNDSCGTPVSTSDPMLGPLADNGGPTQTMVLSASSPAIDAGDDATCEATDQRGVTRLQESHCDIGAYELGGFYISGRNLLDANGNNFIMRGVNHGHNWYPGQTSAFADIKAKGVNTVRVVLSSGQNWTKNSASDVANVISLCKANKLICVLEVHDTTGYSEDVGAVSLAQAVNYWKEIKSALDGQEAYVIINIGNEPYGNTNPSGWINDTKNAIAEMRNAGFQHTLMVDAPNWGQDWQFIMRDNAADIFNSDAKRNLVFSIHMYGVFNTADKIQNYVSTFVNAGLPLVIGEFAHQHTDGDPDENAIVSAAQANGIGYLGWAWSGGGYLDMVNNFDPNQETMWGDRIINGEYGIRKTSREASVYSSNSNPRICFISRANPNPTSATSIEFTVVFSEPVAGVSTSAPFNDFALTTAGVTGATITDVSGSGAIYTVTVNTGSGTGTLRLDVVDDDSIKDAGDNPLGGVGTGNGNITNGEAYMTIKGFNNIGKGTSAFDLSHGWTVSQYVRTTGDVNGDSKGDLVGFGLDGVYVALSNGTSFDAISKWTSAFDLSHGWTVASYVRTVGDVNNDGMADLVGFGQDGVYVALSNGTSFGVISKWTSSFDLSHGWTVKDYVRTVGDVNNDGRADLVGFGQDGVYVALSNGTSFDAISKWTSAFDLSHGWTVKDYVRTAGDVNADGRADLIGFGQDGVYVALSNGTSFGAVSKWTSAFDLSHGWTVKDYVRTVGDVNSDGNVDLVGFGQDGVYIALSTGTGYTPVSKWTSAFDLSHGWTMAQYARTVGDVSGDGKSDLVGFGLDGVYIAISK